MNLEWIWSEHLCYSLILEWPTGITQGFRVIPEVTPKWVNNTNVHSKFTLISLFSKIHSLKSEHIHSFLFREYATMMAKFITTIHSGVVTEVFLNFFFFKNKTFYPDTESVKLCLWFLFCNVTDSAASRSMAPKLSLWGKHIIIRYCCWCLNFRYKNKLRIWSTAWKNTLHTDPSFRHILKLNL